MVSEPESEKLLAGVWQSVVSLTPEFHLLRKLFPRDILIDALDNKLSPTLEHVGPVIQEYFEASAGLYSGNLCAAKGRRWHFDSVSKSSWRPRGCVFQIYSHLFVWGEMKHSARGLAPNNWLLQSTM